MVLEFNINLILQRRLLGLSEVTHLLKVTMLTGRWYNWTYTGSNSKAPKLMPSVTMPSNTLNI